MQLINHQPACTRLVGSSLIWIHQGTENILPTPAAGPTISMNASPIHIRSSESDLSCASIASILQALGGSENLVFNHAPISVANSSNAASGKT